MDHNCPCPHPSHKNKAWNKIRDAWNENPIMVVGVFGAALAGAGKFIEAIGSIPSKRAYAKKYGK